MLAYLRDAPAGASHAMAVAASGSAGAGVGRGPVCSRERSEMMVQHAETTVCGWRWAEKAEMFRKG